MQIGIRVDASGQMGLGHVKRCLSLAHALHDAGATVTFACRPLGVDLSALFADTPFMLRLLEQPGDTGTAGGQAPHAAWARVPQADDAVQTVTALRDLNLAWIIVDHYAFDAGWHRLVATSLGARVAVIDDLADRLLDADLLIDHNLSEDPETKYSKRLVRHARQLMGPRYALLGPGYLHAQRYVHQDAVRSVGIFLGGTDPANLSVQALQACREEAGYAGPIEVVSTSANQHLSSLADECARWPSTTLSVDLPDLAAYFARHDLHIGAGGGATWERCCIGAPTLGLVCADNQRMVLPRLAEAGAVAWVDDTRPHAIAQALRALLGDSARRRSLGERSRALVDGRGAQRVALHMLAPTLSLRPATLDDAQQLHDWRNDERTRSVSSDPRPIAFDDHCRWMRAVLTDPTRQLWVGCVGRVPVGAIRFDRGDTGHFTVSLYLDPSLHGLGLGSHLLSSGETAVLQQATPPLQLHADVLEANLASRRLFEAANYTASGSRYDKRIGPSASPVTHRELAP